MRRTLVILACLVLAAAPAAAAGDCRVDQLGQTICRDLPPVPGAARRGSPIPVERPAIPPADTFIPSTRTDSFGITRPDRRGLTASPRFRAPVSPVVPTEVCRTDSFGNTRCR